MLLGPLDLGIDVVLETGSTIHLNTLADQTTEHFYGIVLIKEPK